MGPRSSPLTCTPEGGFNLSSGGQQHVSQECARPAVDGGQKVEDCGENGRFGRLAPNTYAQGRGEHDRLNCARADAAMAYNNGNNGAHDLNLDKFSCGMMGYELRHGFCVSNEHKG